MWKFVAERTALELIMSKPANQFPVVDGESYMMITPKELVQYSYKLLAAWNDAQLDGTMYDRESAEKGTDNATDDGERVKDSA